MLARVALLAALAAGAACGSDSGTGPTTTPPSSSPVGNYGVTTVNGKSLPVAIFADGNYKYEVTVGTLALTTDGKYSVVTTFRQTISDNVSTFVDSTGGTWVLTGATLALTNAQDGSQDQATWSNGQLTFAETDPSTKVTTTYIYAKK